MRPFKATNKPGTCKWCGWKLRRPAVTVRGPAEYPKRSKCCRAPIEQLSERDPRRMICSLCAGYPGLVRKIISKTPRYDKPGDYGDGHFCGLSCGYRFAVAMANQGRVFAVERDAQDDAAQE